MKIVTIFKTSDVCLREKTVTRINNKSFNISSCIFFVHLAFLQHRVSGFKSAPERSKWRKWGGNILARQPCNDLA